MACLHRKQSTCPPCVTRADVHFTVRLQSQGPNKTFTSSGEANSHHSLVGVSALVNHDKWPWWKWWQFCVFVSSHLFTPLKKQTLLSVQTRRNRNVLRVQLDKISPKKKKTSALRAKCLGETNRKPFFFFLKSVWLNEQRIKTSSEEWGVVCLPLHRHLPPNLYSLNYILLCEN